MEESISKWEKDVIDTSKNNKLLYFDNTGFLKIKSPAMNFLFDDLVNKDKKMSFQVNSEESRKRDEIILSTKEKIIPALRNIYYKSQNSIKEHGSVSLYLSFGILKWGEDAEKPIETQLFFVPVEMTKKIYDEYYIESVAGDIISNPVLKEKLQEYGIKYDFNFNENLNIVDAIKTFKITIKDIKWTVKNNAYLGILSFTNNIIYNDIKENHEKIKNNELTQALAGNFEIVKKINSIIPHNIDYNDVITIMDADSSQLHAILASQKGASFILNGPPGTGKSQTIANIIVDSIKNEKKVLFVSEKKAAIDVVKKRLDDYGFSDFILELHGNRSKSDIIKSLYKSVELKKDTKKNIIPKDRFTGILNDYVSSMHEKRDNADISVYDSCNGIIKNSTDIDVDIGEEILTYSTEELDNLEFQLGEFNDYTDLIENYYEIPIGFNIEKFKDIKEEFYKNLENFQQNTEILIDNVPLIVETTDIKLNNIDDLKMLFNLLSVMDDKIKLNNDLYFDKKFVDNSYEIIQKLTNLKNEYSNMYDIINKKRSAKILDIDLNMAYDVLKNRYRSKLKRLSSEYKTFVNRIMDISNDKTRKGYDEILEDVEYALEVKRKYEEMENIKKKMHNEFSEDDIDQITLAKKILSLFPDGNINDKIKRILSGKADIEGILFVKDLYTKLIKNMNNISALFDPETVIKLKKLDFSNLNQWALNLLSFDMERYLKLYELIKNTEKKGISIKNALGKPIHNNDILRGFYYKFYQKFEEYYVKNDEILRDFNVSSHERLIKMFIEFDKKRMEIFKNNIISDLNLRKNESLNNNPEDIMIIKTENAKKRFQKPLKKLFPEISNILFNIKPCFMMSPINVSSYIDKNLSFDIVIFDEASQITPPEAVGSLFRSKQVIISGDTQQLPPTNFFENVNSSKYDENYVVLDNIMDQFDALGLEKISLKWHYRSIDDKLIAFSNKYFYENSLETFPSAYKNPANSGIIFRYIEGKYGRGNTRANLAEANEVVKIIKEEMNSSDSIGVVTLSEAQRSMIEDIMDEYAKNDEVFSKIINNDDIFIKNLENVQGDERDVIILSIAYGKDNEGKITMNFGPLNTVGGEKRLNVAITRARKKAIIVSSMKPEVIKIPQNSIGKGPELLKKYMQFALYNENDVLNKFSNTDDIINDVYKTLRKAGFKVDKDVGYSRNNIPLAVMDPFDDNHYILGIETDGNIYAGMKTPTERERLRKKILEDRGWNFYRIWSIDYIKNRESVIRNIINTINRLSAQNDSKKIVG